MNKTRIDVLIVEDEFIIASAIRASLLSIPGFQAEIVSTGSAALKRLHKSLPHIVLMDIGLSGDQDGLQTAGMIRNFSNVPILFLSGYSDNETKQRVKNIKYSKLISKPATQNDIKSELLGLLEEHS